MAHTWSALFYTCWQAVSDPHALKPVQVHKHTHTHKRLYPLYTCTHVMFPLFLSFSFQGVKERNVAPQLTDFEIPTSFWYELKNLTETLMDNVNCESSNVTHTLV